MGNINFNKVLCSGILATSVMTVFTNIQGLIGFPAANIPGMLSGFVGMPLLAGWFMHFAIGTILAGFFAYFASKLPFDGWKKGAFYGLFPWLMAMLAVMPMMGMPMFGGSFMMALGSLVAHLIYGGVLGCTYTCEAPSTPSFGSE